MQFEGLAVLVIVIGVVAITITITIRHLLQRKQ